ncbi:MAG TPA: hypothetical protein DD381_05295 [Lentisphaeria bacterium]|nr:MAG: hypothetical protein A2X47_06120 [Lentisphaerae bacterium GWF2_38_69]HBM15746.1 hypothetical protein [Lentisphaeria bacterium]
MRAIYLILSLSEFATALVSPVFAFLFFSTTSTLFPAEASTAERAFTFGIFIALYKFGGMICNPIFGAMSDIMGRKLTTIITLGGIIILAIASIGAIILHSVWLFITGCFFFALFFASKPVCTAAINDLSKEGSDKVKNQALVQFFIGIGVAIGPVAGGYIADVNIFNYDYMFPFIILLICGIYLIFHARFFMRETLRRRERSNLDEQFKFGGIKVIFKDKLLISLLAIHILNQLSWGTYYDFLPAVAKAVFNYDIKSVGILVGFVGFWLIIASGIILPFILKNISGRNLINISCYLGFAGVLAAYLASFFPESSIADFIFWASTLPVAVGDVILFCYLISRFSMSVEKKFQGAVVGFIYITGFGMWSLSAPLGGYLMQFHLNAALLMSPVSMAILILFIFVIRNREFYKSLDNK